MTIQLSLTGKYQLVVLGHDEDPVVCEFSARLVAAVGRAFDQLGVNKKFLVSMMPGSGAPDINRRMPAVAVFMGLVQSPRISGIDEKRLEILLNDEALIIPVVESVANFSSMVTPEIALLNGFALSDCGSEFERLASRSLKASACCEKSVACSSATDAPSSSGAATQLYEALDAAGFDVFLDTHGVIRPGEPFQEILWHRLADTDVAVMLDTPGFLASRWTEEELARANTSNIQILQLLWPGQTELATAAFSMFHPLSEDSFVGPERIGPAAQLKEIELNEIVDEVEGLRARAFGARHSFLVREFAIEARNEGLKVVTNLDRNLVLSMPNGNKVLVMPAIGVPDAERYETLDRLYQRDLGGGRAYAQPPVLLYDQTGIRSRWLKHLEWLNDNIACARSISIADAKKWLGELKANSRV